MRPCTALQNAEELACKTSAVCGSPPIRYAPTVFTPNGRGPHLLFAGRGSIGCHAFDRDSIGDSSSSDLFHGVGGQFDFTNQLSLCAQYRRYGFHDYGDSDEISLDLHYTF